MKLFECTRLSAKINEIACKTNRQRGVFACDKCPGLGAEVKVNTEETGMPKVERKECNEPGCITKAWMGEFCWKHHPQHAENKKAACEDKAEIRQIHKRAEVLAVEEACDKSAAIKFESEQVRVSDHELHVINLIEVFKAKQAAELAAFSNQLSQLTEPYDKLMFTFKAVQI